MKTETEKQLSRLQDDLGRYQRTLLKLQEDKLVYEAASSVLISEPRRQARIHEANKFIPYYTKQIEQLSEEVAVLEKVVSVMKREKVS